MNEFYLFLVIVLFCLAIADLIVGVSNDAVNFLNSAVGSKVAPRYIIMIVASLGIFIGATFSSGIMEVARKGIFNPDFFMFSEVMVIFAAVMLTDIILLDFFNTMGLPTSTTVSIVFELLGAAVVVALIKISVQDQSFDQIGTYINSSRALTIIGGIFLSVIVAFLIGMIVQYLSRLLFSFQFEKRMKFVGAVWSGFALTALTYFIVIKGIKGASFVSKDQIGWFQENAMLILSISFVFWSLVLQILLSVFKVNILKIIILFGTFGLAMAFAGNDLVNFIGVPIAGFESFLFWKDSGVAPDAFTMTQLTEPVQTPTYLLLIAGLIMVVTLWLSKKASTVSETEINLARQTEGSERFNPNALSRGIVRGARSLGQLAISMFPGKLVEQVENNFKGISPRLRNRTNGSNQLIPPQASFDLIRASVNLTVASVLIAFATSLKLPLSTTYVSFMVAMGTSLADRAWGRDSAVYRVSGVLSVIGGWFATAFVAFIVSGIFAVLIYIFNWYAIVILLSGAIFLIIHGVRYHRKKDLEKKKKLAMEFATERLLASKAVNETRSQVAETITIIRTTYRNVIKGVLTEKRKVLVKARKDIEVLGKQNNLLKKSLYKTIQRIEEEKSEISSVYLKVYNLERDLIQSMNYIAEAGFAHVENVHNPLSEDQVNQILEVRDHLSTYLEEVVVAIKADVVTNYQELVRARKAIDALIDVLLDKQVIGIKEETYSSKNSMLYFNILLETRDLLGIASSFIKLLHKSQVK